MRCGGGSLYSPRSIAPDVRVRLPRATHRRDVVIAAGGEHPGAGDGGDAVEGGVYQERDRFLNYKWLSHLSSFALLRG